MKAIAVGDSFTYGEELTNPECAWPILLSTLTGYSITNSGRPAAGNRYMVRTVVENINQADLFIIAWSHCARQEFADEWGVFDVWPGSSSKQFNHPDIRHRKDLVKYLTLHHNDLYFYTQFLIDVITIQTLCQANNKRCLMFSAFGNNQLHARYKQHTTVNKLTDQIRQQYFVGWPNETMMEWTYGTEQGAGGHFLEKGHALVAEKIHAHIRNLGWLPRRSYYITKR